MDHKEFHPVIEGYVADYVDGTLSGEELFAFQELLIKDADLKRYVESVKIGKYFMEQLREGLN